jgi:transposase
VQVHLNFYSVPYALVRQIVDVRLTARAIELFHKGRRIAAHRRCYARGQYITDPGHRPKAHARHLDWSPGRLIAWADDIGSECAQLVRTLLETKPHPEQGYRACLGLMRLAKRDGIERTEAACARALALDSPSYQTVSSILKHGKENDPLPGQRQLKPPTPGHHNVRGHAYYQGKD